MADATISLPEEEVPLPPVEDVEVSADVGGSSFSLTVEDVPELSDVQVGDEITFQISDITEDGNYSLIVSPAAPEAGLEEAGVEPEAGGQDAVLEQLIG